MGEAQDLYVHELDDEGEFVLVSTDEKSSYGAKTLLENRAVALGTVEDSEKNFYHTALEEDGKHGLEATIEKYLIDRRINPLDVEYHEDRETFEDLVDQAWSTMTEGEPVTAPKGYDPSKDDMRF